MTNDEIIPSRTDVLSMAREAGCTANEANAWCGFLERFAALIASRVAAKASVASASVEREACAKVCESLFDMEDDSCNEAEQCAAAIRARGNT